MTMHTDPTAAFEVVPAKFFLGFAKASFDLPPAECDPQKIANRPTVAARDSVTEEVFQFAGANVHSDDQCAGMADKIAVMCLAITAVPLNIPHFGPLVRVSHALALRGVVTKAR
jgi:hypothetical protein